MVKKFISVFFTSVILFLSANIPVMAESTVLEIDKESDMFKTDVWQNDGDKNVWPLSNATEVSPLSGASAELGGVKRFCGSVMQGETGVEGSAVLTDGVSNFSVYLPLKQASDLNKITLKFPVGSRRYYFRLYTSADGTTWNEADIKNGAEKITVVKTFGTGSAADGPGIDCYASVPALVNTNTDDTNLTVFYMDKIENIQYVKFTFYGNDGGNNSENVVANKWVSFNNLILEKSDEPQPTSTPIPTSTSNRSATPAGSEDITDNPNFSTWIIVFIAAGIIVAAVVIAIIVRLRKKN